MPDAAEATARIAAAASWDERVSLIRRIPEDFGTAVQPALYSMLARDVYVPHLAPHFAYIHWTADYELEPFVRLYADVERLTQGFRNVDVDSLLSVIHEFPGTIRVFRTILGFTTQEFAAATDLLAATTGGSALSVTRVKAMETGRRVTVDDARVCAELIDQVLAGDLFSLPSHLGTRSKIEKPDTADGWSSVRAAASDGVPYEVLLHQRHYGGAFRQLLDATSTSRGDILEDAVSALFTAQQVPFIRTGSSNQEEIARRFGLTVRPAPDFVLFDPTAGVLRAILECKVANDGGTARDKAARFRTLRTESTRLGGVPLFAVLSGLGWRRTGDALGPVVSATDGRTFTFSTLAEMMTVQPLPALRGLATASD